MEREHRRRTTGALALMLVSLLSILGVDGMAEETNPSAGELSHHVYFLPDPIEIQSELGPLLRGLHLGGQIVYALAKTAAIAYAAGSKPHVLLPVAAYELVKAPAYAHGYTRAHLALLQSFRKQNGDGFVERMSGIPGIEKIVVLTSPNFRMRLGLAATQIDRDFVFLETREPLPPPILDGHESESWRSKWGKPVEISDPSRSRVELRVTWGGSKGRGSSPVAWSVPLKELLQGPLLPSSIAETWRRTHAEIGPGLVDRILHRSRAEPEMRAVLIGADGHHQELGVILQGKALKRFLGVTLLTQFRRAPAALPLGGKTCGVAALAGPR